MAYTQPPYFDGRGPPHPMRRDEGRPPWPQPYQPSAYNPRPPPNIGHYDPMDPESSDSDVSVAGSDSYRTGDPAVPVPPAPPKHVLETADGVQNRLHELNHVDESNIRKQQVLADKRRRKDIKIAQKRDAQDRKWKSIMDARERRNARINRRRAGEDARYRAIEEQIEEEENALRRRLKRLKRGLPPDESPRTVGRSTSASPMSPPGPSFSTIPPPAKRHQPGPPGQMDGVHSHHQGPLPPLQSNTSSAPSYSFYQGNQKPYSVPYHNTSNYSTVPPPPQPPPPPLPPAASTASASATNPPASLSSNLASDRSPYTVNGRPASPAPRPLPSNSTPYHDPSPGQSRQPSSSYDTRPPPPASGFASINAPAHAGFAAVNARSAATPPSAYSSLSRPPLDTRTPNAAFPDAQLEPSRHDSNGQGSNSASSTPAAAAGGKRTPSTTHPYQMSEAFANRHHHCERVDGLNRGIWTYHGPNLGTADRPTGPPEEMYLRCNHDNCRRIDWRTVHGLQCHIVKNHEQPKGTIGSLEKALDRYGVRVSEVEDYEREHGEGTGGTMADPKNLKIKNKLREGGRKSAPGPAPGSWGLEPTVRPAGYKPSPGPTPLSERIAVDRDMGDFVARRSAGYIQDEVAYSDTDDSARSRAPSTAPKSRFEAIRGDWRASTPSRRPSASAIDANRQLQGSAVMENPEDAAAARPSETAPGGQQWATANMSTRPFTTAATLPAPSTLDSSRSNINDPSAQPPPSVPASAFAVVNAAQAPEHTIRQVERYAPNETTVEQRGEKVDSSSVTPALTDSHTARDTPMSGVAETSHAPMAAAKGVPPAEVEDGEQENTAPEAPTQQPAAAATDDAMQVDSSKASDEEPKAIGTERRDNDTKEPTSLNGPARGTRSAVQSPIITQKTLNPPGSVKRSSRRSSTVRKLSGDGSADGHTGNSSNADEVDGVSRADGSARGTDDGEVADGDSITVAVMKRQKEEDLKEKEAPKTPPRRSATGRFVRKRNNLGY